MSFILSSSGARHLYLENIVRALALPPGTSIQFRYEEDIVCPAFVSMVETNKTMGLTCYLSYLDNRDRSKTPDIFPVREAVIEKAIKRGSSFIIQLALKRYIAWDKCPDIGQKVRQELAVDALPDWHKNNPNPSGFWVAQTNPLAEEYLIEHDTENAGHLLAFEATANALEKGEDFKSGEFLFANILGIHDLSNGKVNDKLKLKAPGNFEVKVYHYMSTIGSHGELPEFEIEVSSENSQVTFLNNAIRRIEAEYDEIGFQFSVSEDITAKKMGLNVTSSYIGADNQKKQIMAARLPLAVKKGIVTPLARFSAITLGLFLAQYITLAKLDKFDGSVGLGILGSAMLAAAATVYRIRTK